MAKFTFDNHYAVLKQIHSNSQRQIQAVLDDVDLSESGKARAIERIKAERAEELAKLKGTFDGDVQKTRDLLSRKADPKPSIRETLRRRAADDAEMFSTIFSDDIRFNLLIDAVEKVESRFDNFLESWALMQRDESWFRKELQRGLDSKNVGRLEQLSKALPLLPNGDISERLQSEYGAAISSIRESMLTPAARESRNQVSELDKAAELFNYSVANVDTRDEFVDPRTQEVGPATVLTAVNPRLGTSPRQEQFQRYKTGGSQGPTEN